VASIGITVGRGSKGAGDVEPAFSDLLSNGGVVAPERVQFLLWTFVGIAAFLLCVLSADATTISDLPAIPPRLVALTGVSATGYLGGKLARTPGPIIDEILAKIGTVQLSILGHNLAADAVVEIEGISVANYLDATAHPEHRARPVNASGSADLATTLELNLASAPAGWVKDTLRVTVTNPDGQRATWPFTVDSTLKAELQRLATLSPIPNPSPNKG
jgi:hypothetical protein